MRIRAPLRRLRVPPPRVLLTIGTFGPAALVAIGAANAIENVNGSVDVSSVQTEIDGESRSSVRQQHRLEWTRDVDRQLKLHLAVSYFRFNLQDVQNSTAWREDTQPSGELIWRHPRLTFNANARRRRSTSLESTQNVTSDDWSLYLRTRSETWPVATLRYEGSRSFDRSASSRDTRERRVVGNVDHITRSQSIAYQLEQRRVENVVSRVRGTTLRSILRWDARPAPLADNRLRVDWSYTYQYSRLRREAIEGDVVLFPLSASRGLFGIDPSPDLGALESVPGLLDGNTDIPVDPPIDLGGDALDRNIGVDLLTPQPVTAIYVYTDRASGDGVTWRVFVSDDNLSWNTLASFPTVERNATLNRYEIGFPPVETRYVKVVTGGLNPIQTVYVTELEVLEALEAPEPIENVLNSHRADGRLRYSPSEVVGLFLDAAYQHVPSAARPSRDDYSYSASGVYDQTKSIAHTLRWEQEFRRLGGGSDDFSTNSVSYALVVDPIPTARATMSLRSRHGFVERSKVEENNAATVQLTGTPLTGLDLAVDVRRSRNHDYASSRRLDSWSFRVGGDAALLRWLRLDASMLRQRTVRASDDLVRRRTTTRVGLDVRVTRTIFSRGSVNITDDVRRDVVHDYLIGWNLSPKLILNGQTQINVADGRIRSERYIAHVTYRMGARGSLYASYIYLDQTAVGGSMTGSFQQGFRFTF